MDQSERDELRRKIAEARKETLQLQQVATELREPDIEIPPPTSSWCCGPPAP